MLNKYIKKEILPYEFRSKFLEIHKQNSEKTVIFLKDFQKLGNLVLYTGSEKFGDLMSTISTLCLEFDIFLFWSDCDADRMSEEEFYLLVKRYSSEFLQEQLIYRSFKLLILALGLGLLLLSSIFELKT